jgi:phosphopantetheinyl transferase
MLAMNATQCLLPGTVQVWQADLGDSGWDALAHVLDALEEYRATLASSSVEWERFRRCRTALRFLLARIDGRDPASIAFRTGRFGKPEPVAHPCRFSVGYCGRFALISLFLGPVGVRVQPLDTPLPRGGPAAVCHPDELAALALLSAAERKAALQQLWTQKIAYCKAVGASLVHSLPAISFVQSCFPGVSRVLDDGRADNLALFAMPLAGVAAGSSAALCLPLIDPHVAILRAAPSDWQDAARPLRTSRRAA